VTNDYFGILANVSLEEMEHMALSTYMLIFRFSIEKLTHYLSHDPFLMLVCEYLKKTRMERVHKRQVLVKNHVAYYRTVENMCNLSEKSSQVIALIQSCVLSPEEIQVTKCSQLTISLQRLLEINQAKNIVVVKELENEEVD
jgi:hypothetical protein